MTEHRMTDDRHPPSLIVVRPEPPLGWLIVNRPEARNALNRSMWLQMAAGIRELAENDEIRVLIVTGAGDASFIAGADIAELRAQLEDDKIGDEEVRESLLGLQAITETPKPVIAMINGHCFGGGVLIALTCDIRIAAESAAFGITAAKLGLAYPLQQGILRLIQTIGPANAADLLFSGRAVDAAEAQRMGLVNRVHPGQHLEEQTRAYAAMLAQAAPLSIAAHKMAIQQTLQSHAGQDWERAEAAARACFRSGDYREGLAAFFEKRPPLFTGR
ncbi:MAG: enoyl-CoA hydratase-related protein [Blastocatellia bacterium]|nr:enoyl-CoA hydratase-related protein [Blastocatellia bacterium]